MNMCSLRNKGDRLEAMIASSPTDPDVIMLTETHLDTDVQNTEFIDTDKYFTYRQDRTRFGGGVAILIKHGLATHVSETYTGDDIIAIRITYKGKSTHFCTYYRPPNKNDFSELAVFMESKDNDEDIFLCGDFNLPDIDWLSKSVKKHSKRPSLHTAFLDTLAEHGLVQHVREPTHRAGNILDLVLSNNQNMITDIIVEPGLSDHYAIRFTGVNPTLKLLATPRPTHNRPYYLFDKVDKDSLEPRFASIEREICSLASKNSPIETVWACLCNGISDIMNDIPQASRKGKPKSWMNRTCLHIVRRRKRAYSSWKRGLGTEETYIMLTKKAKRVIQATKRAFINGHLEQELTKGNSKPLYKYISSKRRSKGAVGSLKINGVTIDEPIAMADVFNTAFSSVFTVDNGVVPSLAKSSPAVQSSIFISEPGISKLLLGLDVRKAAGPDGISCAFLKTFEKYLTPTITRIFQLSLDQGETPKAWRTANVCPVYKSGALSDPLNYRPIALTSVLCKSLEHIIASSIRDFLQNNNILIDEQHGFRAKRSCESQLVVTYHSILEYIDVGRPVDAVVLDFSKAFDKVSHPKLIAKLTALGINSNITKWITSWLTGRDQKVVVEGVCSKAAPVTSGVPQGSVLGPLLFLIYINDIRSNINNHLRLFADDALLFGPVTDNTEKESMRADLKTLEDWARGWQMAFNTGKCEVLHFTPCSGGTDFTYELDNTKLGSKDSGKYLGITITTDLSWKTHIEKISNKAKGLLGMLRRQLKGATTRTKLITFKTIVRPCLEYAAAVWSPSRQADADQLERIQRQAVRWIHGGLGRDESVTAARISLGLEELCSRRVSHDRDLLGGMLCGDVDVAPPTMAVQTNPYPTRHNSIHPHTNTNLLYHSFFPRSVRHK